MKEIPVRTTKRAEFVDITGEVRGYLRESKADSGLVTVFVPHTTAGVTINENADPDVVSDMTGFMSSLVPPSEDFRHGEGNSDAHIKSSLFSPSLTLLVEDGELRAPKIIRGGLGGVEFSLDARRRGAGIPEGMYAPRQRRRRAEIGPARREAPI